MFFWVEQDFKLLNKVLNFRFLVGFSSLSLKSKSPNSSEGLVIEYRLIEKTIFPLGQKDGCLIQKTVWLKRQEKKYIYRYFLFYSLVLLKKQTLIKDQKTKPIVTLNHPLGRSYTFNVCTLTSGLGVSSQLAVGIFSHLYF